MTSAQWIDEFKAAEDMKRREIAEKEERRRKRKAALEEKAAWRNQEVAKEHNAALLASQMLVEDFIALGISIGHRPFQIH